MVLLIVLIVKHAPTWYSLGLPLEIPATRFVPGISTAYAKGETNDLRLPSRVEEKKLSEGDLGFVERYWIVGVTEKRGWGRRSSSIKCEGVQLVEMKRPRLERVDMERRKVI